jgi:hypothetical protein
MIVTGRKYQIQFNLKQRGNYGINQYLYEAEISTFIVASEDSNVFYKKSP